MIQKNRYCNQWLVCYFLLFLFFLPLVGAHDGQNHLSFSGGASVIPTQYLHTHIHTYTNESIIHTHQWYHPSQLPSQPIIGDPSSGLVHCGQYQTSPPGLTATPGNFTGGNRPPLPEGGVVCCHDDGAPGNADSSSLGSFIWGMFEPLFLPDFALKETTLKIGHSE